MKRVSGRVTRRKLLKDMAMGGAIMVAMPRSYLSGSVPSEAMPAGMETGDWLRFGYDLQNTRFNSKEDVLVRDNVERLKVKWIFETDAPIQTTPTVVGDTLYFGTLSGYQYAVESSTGKVKWKFFAGYTETPVPLIRECVPLRSTTRGGSTWLRVLPRCIV